MGRGRRGGNPASVKENNFWNTLNKNAFLDNEYFRRLVELSCAMFEWKNLPEGMDERYIEMGLFRDGRMLFFKDEDLPEGQQYLCTRCTAQGPYDMYNIPIYRTAFANNGYNRTLSKEDSVIIFNNYLHTNSWIDICGKAERLSNIDQTIDVNVNAQKTPVLILCDENEKLTMLNLYQQYEGNTPVIFGTSSLNPEAIQCLRTDAPYISKDLYELKTQYWNEALTYLGISNVSFQKKERMVSDEVTRNQGGTIANRYSRLEMRRNACKEINEMFDLSIDCDFRADFEIPLDLNEEQQEKEAEGEQVKEQGEDPRPAKVE